MKLYKFRSFENIEYILDIILEERLYCALHIDLNDPFEGLFSTIEWKGGGIVRSIVQPIVRPIVSDIRGNYPQRAFKTLDKLPALDKNVRVCSLSSTMKDVRMWSLYSSGHTGCVIEIDIDLTPDIVQVRYTDGLQHFKDKIDANTKARDILSFKTKHWDYEQEYRIISENDFYPVENKISAIYLGLRSKEIHRNIITKVIGKSIPVYDTKLNQASIEVQPNKRVN